MISVWAANTNFPAPCQDARPGGDWASGDTPSAQSGWQMAFQFENLHDLATKLSAGVPMPAYYCGNWVRDCAPVGPGQIHRLAIEAHGDVGGRVMVDGSASSTWLEAATLPSYHSDLHTIGLYTRRGSVIYFMSCVAGQGQEGTRLLLELSRVWPGRAVVGFSTYGYFHAGEMGRHGQCLEAGLRDTGETNPLIAHNESGPGGAYERNWSDLLRLPWLEVTSPHTKIAINQMIVKWPDGEQPPASPPPLERGLTSPPALRHRHHTARHRSTHHG